MIKLLELISLLIGLLILCAGSYYERLPDWDIGISLIMGILTYLTAPWVVGVILARNWRMLPLTVLFAWASIDGSYWIYNVAMHHAYVREANALCSTPLYFMMGLFWNYLNRLLTPAIKP